MDTVAARAGVSKATIYRWWPTKELLAVDALYEGWQTTRPQLRGTGSLKGELIALLRPWVRMATQRPWSRVVAALLAKAQADEEFGAYYRERFLEPRRRQIATIIERAIERGELDADTKTEVAIDLIYGACYHRLLQGHRPLNDRFMREVVDLVVAGLRIRHTAPSPS
jgi:AcrR family transcriptional regulator